MSAPATIEDLICHIAYGDAAAYKELFYRYHTKLLRFAQSIVHSREAAEEVVSDVFLKIWTKRTTLLNVRNPHLFLYVLTKNLSINQALKQKREATFSLDHMVVEFHSVYFDPEQQLITAEMLRRVQAAIAQLPPQCKLIFKLVKEDGLKYKEVAELLHLSPKTVENQMTIALRKIQASIKFLPASASSN